LQDFGEQNQALLGSGRPVQYNPVPRVACGSLDMRMLLIIFASVSLSGCAGMLLGGGSTSERAPATRQSTSPTSADSALSGALRQQYSADDEISQYGIGIRAVSGRVTLTGTVGSYAIRDRVVAIARNTRGVTSVDSRVVVNTNMR